MFKKTLTSLILTLVAFGGFFGVNIHHDTEKLILSGISETYAECITDKDGKRVCDNYNATNENTPNTDDEATRKLFNAIATTVNLLIDLLTILVTPAVMLASWLISPDWTSGDLFNLRPTIHSLWVLVSNIVYFIYAILLIVIALATIFNSDNYGYKAMLPKLALGIILVPLTWWMVQFTISLATYVTASVITIPQETMFKLDEVKCSGDSQNCWQNRPSIPMEIMFVNAPSGSTQNIVDQYNQDNASRASGKGCTSETCYTPKQFLSNLGGTYGQLIVYAYGVFRISDMKKLDTTWNKVESLIGIIHQGIIGSILFMIFGILVLALATMLFIRAIKLWVYAIFSPLFTIHFVTGGALFGGDNKESFSIKEFLGLAFVPAVVGLALSFGLVIIGAIQSTSTENPNLQPCNSTNIKAENPNDENAGCKILGFMGNDNNKIVKMLVSNGGDSYVTLNKIIIGGITFMYYGEPIGQAGVQKVVDGANNATGIIGNASGTIGTLIVDIIAIVFIWVAFMAAKGVSKAVAAVVDPFEKMGKNIADLGMKLPKYTPLPIPGGSIAGMEKSSGMVNQLVDAKFEKDFKSKGLGKRLNEALGGGSTEDIARFRQATKTTNATQALKDTSSIANSIRNNGNGETLYRSEEFKGDLKELLKRLKMENVSATEIRGIGGQGLVDLVNKIDKDGNGLNDDDIIVAMAHLTGNKNTPLNRTVAQNYLNQKGNNTTSSTSTNNITIEIKTDQGDKSKNILSIAGKDIQLANMDARSISDAIKGSRASLSKTQFSDAFKNALINDSRYGMDDGNGGKKLKPDGETLLSSVESNLNNSKDFKWAE